MVDFGKNVMKEFLGENYVHCGEVVQPPLEFVKQLRLKVQQYCIAMTAKDCSIMIALSPCLQDARSDQRPVIPSSRPRFAFFMSVVDLDLKPYESIPYQYKLDGKNQYKLDGKIINYYSKTVRAKDNTMMSTRFKESEDRTLILHKI
nr:inositol-pentakisphosphate 2-kinase-like [Gorilla gorilla gorilla]